MLWWAIPDRCLPCWGRGEPPLCQKQRGQHHRSITEIRTDHAALERQADRQKGTIEKKEKVTIDTGYLVGIIGSIENHQGIHEADQPRCPGPPRTHKFSWYLDAALWRNNWVIDLYPSTPRFGPAGPLGSSVMPRSIQRVTRRISTRGADTGELPVSVQAMQQPNGKGWTGEHSNTKQSQWVAVGARSIEH